jgi:dihydrodipicolinate synthase/N-acetylneuraminate lyase
VKAGTGTEPIPRTFCVVANIAIVEGIMPNPLYRAQRCRDLAEECRAIAALCAPSTEIRAHYSRMAQHYGALAEAEELGILAYGR